MGRQRKKHPAHYRAVDVNRLAAGFAALAFAGTLFVCFPDHSSPALYRTVEVLMLVVAIIGVCLLVTSWPKVPVAISERPWREALNEFRDTTAGACRSLDHIEARFPNESAQVTPWRELARTAPWPNMDERPAKEWDAYLASAEAPTSARHLYAFAKRLSGKPTHTIVEGAFASFFELDSWRRHSINTLDDFGNYLSANTRGIGAFLERNAVREGFSDVIMLLAYLDIAHASQQKGPPQAGNTQEGFWSLGVRWMGETVSLMPMHQRPRLKSNIEADQL